MLGITLGQQEKWDEAREHLRLAAELDPSDVEASNAWGTVLARDGRLQEAAEQFRHTLSIDAANAYARTSLAKVAAEQGPSR
jgi:Flp pilus assembly protein TadD